VSSIVIPGLTRDPVKLDPGSEAGVTAVPGFSLIEILIAALLLGMIGIILMQSLSSALDVRDRVLAISGRHHLIRQALARMTRELSMAYVSDNRNKANLVVDTQFMGRKDSVSWVAFGGLRHRQNAKESGEREISYFIKDGNLVRREKPNPGRQPFEEGRVKLVCPKIDSLSLKYWNPVTSAWDSEWKTEGKPMNAVTLPPRVRIELSAKINDDETEKITTEIEIWLTKPIFQVK